MTLRTTMATILLGVGGLALASVWLIQQHVLFPSFLALEEQSALRNLSRILHALDNEVAHLDSFTADWGAWDETYRFVAEQTPRYIEDNLSKSYFEGANFTAAWYLDTQGKVVFGLARDPDQDLAEIRIPGLSEPSWPLTHPALANKDITKGISGLLATERGAMLMSSRPIITSQKQGPMRGWLVLAKSLTTGLVEGLRRQTALDFELLPWDRADLDTWDSAARTALTTGATTHIELLDDEHMRVAGAVNDITGKPVLMVRASLPRDVTLRGAETLRFALGSAVVLGLVLLLVLMRLLSRFVIAPVVQLTAHAVAIGRSDDLQRRLDSRRHDELGVLASTFDAMVDRLADSRRKLADLAHRSGRSEAATSVLHNVGNALNGLVVARDVLQQKLDAVAPTTFGKLRTLLAEHEHDLARYIAEDAAGRHLPRFLRLLTDDLERGRQDACSELEQLGGIVEHVRALVAAQQDLAGDYEAPEPCDLAELIGQAVQMTAGRTARPVAVEIDVAADLQSPVLHRHKLLETLVNLIANARDAVAAAGRPGRVTVRAFASAAGSLQVDVRDDGVGIAADDLPRLFTFGFTTKPDGHGFGLHAAANTIRSIGGSLRAASDGPGRGACLSIELPLRLPAPAEALR